jgi:RecA/RadA recombinase
MLTPAFLEAWLDYIKLEEMTAAEVERGRGPSQRVYDEQLSLVGNKLVVEQALWRTLKAAATAQDQAQLALSGPRVYLLRGKGQSQKLIYLPLFTIDVTSLLQGPYRKGGWEVTQLPFQPIVPNLVRVCGLSEAAAERVLVSRGLLAFLEALFEWKFQTLQEAIHHPPPRLNKRLQCHANAYLLWAHRQPYNTQLKAQLRQRLTESRAPETPESAVASRYLYGRPTPPVPPRFWFGLFPSHAPDADQAIALKQAQTNPLTAICGPPGTGKTEVFLHRLAQLQIERAAAIACDDQDANHLCVVAAKNNSVLDRFRQRLGDALPCLPGGNRTTIRQLTLKALQHQIDHLRQAAFHPEEWDAAQQRFVRQYRGVQALMTQALDAQQARQQAQDDVEQLTERIAALDSDIATLTAALAAPSPDPQDPPPPSIPVEAYRDIRTALEEAWQSMPRPSDSPLKRSWNWLTATHETAVIRRLERRLRPAILSTLATAHPFQLPLTFEQLSAARQRVNDLLNQVHVPEAAARQREQQQGQITALEQERATLEPPRTAAQDMLNRIPDRHPEHDFFQVDREAHVLLFQCSRRFLEQEMLRRKAAVIAALQIYGDALQGDEAARAAIAIEGQTVYRDLSLAFPVMTSTVLSLNNMQLTQGSIRQALIDEAGSMPVHQAYPLLQLATQAIVAGDPYQVEPILTLCEGAIDEYRREVFTGDLQPFYATHAPTARYTATAYHRAAGTDATGQGGQAVLLKTHYRSAPAIAQFCAPTYPEPLIVQSPERPSRLGPNLIAYDVEGYYDHNINPAEVSAIDAIVAELLQHGYTLTHEPQSPPLTIGVLSPFYHQVQALQQRLKKRWKTFPIADIATVHNFQGAEKSVIVFSAYTCSSDDDFWFLNRAPNLLNTAVSRAQELFILVGNLTQLEQAGGETRRLVEHIRALGEIRDTPD